MIFSVRTDDVRRFLEKKFIEKYFQHMKNEGCFN